MWHILWKKSRVHVLRLLAGQSLQHISNVNIKSPNRSQIPKKVLNLERKTCNSTQTQNLEHKQKIDDTNILQYVTQALIQGHTNHNATHHSNIINTTVTVV